MQVPIEKIQKIVTLDQVMDCFFDGGLAGYAGGGKYVPILGIPGMKSFIQTYEMPEPGSALVYNDAYGSVGPESFGFTTITLATHGGYEQTPIWEMQYEGREFSDDKAVISLLKKALLATYSEKIFYGGRGPARYTSPNFSGLTYMNRLVIQGRGSNFRHFRGQEVVNGSACSMKFCYNYSGKLLVPLNASPHEKGYDETRMP